MPKPLANDFQMDALFQEQRCMRVPEIVQANARRTCYFHERVEAMREIIRPNRSAVRYSKDQVMIPPCRAAL